MSVRKQDIVDFQLTGRHREAPDESPADACPALLAPYRDLESLRYDFPLILLESAETQAYVDSLTAVINRLLREIAPEGNAGTLLRQHVLRLETRMRALAPDRISLQELWQQAERSLLEECGENETELLGNSIATARFALRVGGTVVDCDDRLPARLFRHAWDKVEAQRARVSLERIETLIIRLRDMLKVDDLKKSGSRTPQKLRMTLGRRYREAFDFELMSEILEGSTPHNRLPPARRARIADALSVLESQKFFALFETTRDRSHYGFVFNHLTSALKSYDERLPAMAEVVKAIEIADLELDNAYQDDRHAAYFAGFGAQALSPEDLAMFPSYLVCLNESECNTRDTARLMQIVSRELPMKVLVQVNDALGEPSPIDGYPHQGSYVQQLAHTFLAGNAFVVQSPASNLYRQAGQIRRGFEYDGPAIFSVFVPLSGTTALPPYLVAAAAMESRVFPAFSYDPAAGAGLADRFDIDGNPDVESDWPVRELRYEDKDLQAITEGCAFSHADFAVTDGRYAGHFAGVAQEDWDDGMVPLTDYLDLSARDTVDKAPYVCAVDAENRLWRMIVDDNLVRIVRRCRDRWHSLQELGGVHNSYAAAAREQARAEYRDATTRPPENNAADAGEAIEKLAESPPATPAIEAETESETSDDPWIETPRCTTCDECTNRNPRMFAYDDNKQAYIRDPDAGTFRELVEAAETCQVSIIHPGKPRNPDEPDLADLIKRAEPFNA